MRILTKDIANHLLNSKFLIIEYIDIETGEIKNTVGSIRDCTTDKMNEYIKLCNRWIGEFYHIDVPEPDKDYKFKQDFLALNEGLLFLD